MTITQSSKEGLLSQGRLYVHEQNLPVMDHYYIATGYQRPIEGHHNEDLRSLSPSSKVLGYYNEEKQMAIPQDSMANLQAAHSNSDHK